MEGAEGAEGGEGGVSGTGTLLKRADIIASGGRGGEVMEERWIDKYRRRLGELGTGGSK